MLTLNFENSDHTLEQPQAAITLKEAEFSSNEKFATDRLSEAGSSPAGGLDHHVHPTHDADGEVWIYPTHEDISGPHALRRVVDKMYVLSLYSGRVWGYLMICRFRSFRRATIVLGMPILSELSKCRNDSRIM